MTWLIHILVMLNLIRSTDSHIRSMHNLLRSMHLALHPHRCSTGISVLPPMLIPRMGLRARGDGKPYWLLPLHPLLYRVRHTAPRHDNKKEINHDFDLVSQSCLLFGSTYICGLHNAPPNGPQGDSHAGTRQAV